MIDLPSIRPETRFGIPSACDALLFNRHYVVGYSYLFRQPRYALELITSETLRDAVDRKDLFREDPRIPSQFAPTLQDYAGSGYHRGHLVCSQNKSGSKVENSETFLLSNMCPQLPALNSGQWMQLEAYLRDLAKRPDVLEVYVACGPLFMVRMPIDCIGYIPVPHAFWKSWLTVSDTGRLQASAAMLLNEPIMAPTPWQDRMIAIDKLESMIGLPLWDRIREPGFIAGKAKAAKPQ